MHGFKTVLGSTVVCILLASCAVSTPVTVDTCPTYDSLVSPFKPLESNARKVVFLGVTNNTVPVATEAGLVSLVESGTNFLVGEAGAEIVDPTLALELQDQIRRYEIRGESSYSSSLATDAIRIEIAQTDISSSFSEASSYQDSDGKTHRNPASCSFKATISGSLKIYSVNPLMLTETIPIEGKGSTSIDMGSSRCPLPPGTDAILLRSAAENAANAQNFKKGVFGYFRQVGYVREVRVCADQPTNNFVFLSTRPQDGAAPGSDVNFFRQYYFEDKITGTRMLRKKIIASGKIVDTANADEAWVKIDERDDAQQIQLGDIVEVIQDSCLQAYDWMCGTFGLK
jgi:hypothetical protein